jgi:hypothetical protein
MRIKCIEDSDSRLKVGEWYTATSLVIAPSGMRSAFKIKELRGLFPATLFNVEEIDLDNIKKIELEN